MKKILMILVALIVMISGNVFAQETHPKFLTLPFDRQDVVLMNVWYYSLGNFHGGIDYNLSYEDVLAAAGGTVETALDNQPNTYPDDYNWGNYVRIDHGNGFKTIYAHLKTGEIIVGEGDSVSRGEIIATSGNTGYSSTPHLHFEVWGPSTGGEYANGAYKYDPYGIYSTDGDEAPYINNEMNDSIRLWSTNPPSYSISAVGYFADYVWDNNVSQAFLDKYNSLISGGHDLGDSWDNGPYGVFVHLQNHMYIQDFNGVNNGYEHPYTALIRDENAESWDFPFVLKDGFWDAWTTEKRWLILGSVMSNEYTQGSYHLQDFRHYGVNYPENANDYKDYHLRYDTVTQIIVPLDENDQPSTFAELKVEQGSSLVKSVSETRNDNFPVYTDEKITKGEISSIGGSEGGGAFISESTKRIMAFADKSAADGVYHSGISVANFGEPIELIDGDSYGGFYAVLNQAVVPIDDFTMNGNSTIYIDTPPPGSDIQFDYWVINPNPGTVGQSIYIEANIFNDGFADALFSELRLELLDPYGQEVFSHSEYNTTVLAGGGWYQWMSTPPYMGGNHTARFRGLLDGEWITYAIQSVYVNDIPPVADFSRDVWYGNLPLTVHFTDQSTHNPTSWLWDFGDGDTSTEQNPTHIYTVAGTYQVSLTVSNSGGSDTEVSIHNYITVIPQVVASFTYDTGDAFAPILVSFTNTSLYNSTFWVWDFGNGQTSTLQSPTNVYNQPGTYNVVFIAGNATSSDTCSTDVYIKEHVVPQFIADVTSGATPLTVQFTDQSGGNPTSWAWDFGDSTTSTEQNPIHVYTTSGAHTVQLDVANDDESASKVRTDYITADFHADFIADVTTGATPLTVQFTDQSVGNPTSWAWDFGDSGISTEHNPTYVYTSEGLYNVTLVATNAFGDDTFTRTCYIYVIRSVYAQFVNSSDNDYFAPTLVSFQDVSPGNPTSWAWDFGDSTISTKQNPTHMYNQPGDYSVTLVASNNTSSSDFTKVITIKDHMVPDFTADVTTGAAPLTVQFTDLSEEFPASWLWDFGDSTSTSNSRNTWHTYTTPGVYSVRLDVTNDDESDFIIKTDYITVVDSLAVDFMADITSGSAPLTVQFTDQSGGHSTFWAWDFGDSGISTEHNPTHTYTTPGVYSVRLDAANDNESNFIVKTDYIIVASAVDFTADVTSGLAPLTVQFTDQSGGTPISWAWDFGDSATSTEQNSTHTYTTPGVYSVRLDIDNGVGPDFIVKADYIFAEEPGSNLSNGAYHFDGVDQYLSFSPYNPGTSDFTVECWVNLDAYSDIASVLFKQGADGDPVCPSLTIVVRPAGNLIFRARGIPDCNFGLSSNSVIPLNEWVHIACSRENGIYRIYINGQLDTEDYVGVNSNIIGITTPGNVARLYNSAWLDDEDYLQGSVDEIHVSNVARTALEVLNHYAVGGEMIADANTVLLWHMNGDIGDSGKLVNAQGDSAFDLIEHNNPIAISGFNEERLLLVADFTATPTNVYTLSNVQFTDQSSGNPTSWLWNFGNNVTSTEQNPSYAYPIHGTYTISLTVGDGISSDTLVKTDYIISSKPPEDNDIYPYSEPNPSNPISVIKFKVNKPGHVNLSIFDVQGRRIQTLIDQNLGIGVHQATFDGTNFASGLYFYMISSTEGTDVRKIMLVK